MTTRLASLFAATSLSVVAALAPTLSYAACVNPSPPATEDAGLVYSADGKVHMFYKGGTGLMHGSVSTFAGSLPNGVNLQLEDLGGSNASSKPAVVSWGSGHVAAFVRGYDNGLYYYQIDNGAHSGWQALGGSNTYNPSAVSLGPGHMIVFTRGSTTTEGIWYREFSSGVWGGWVQLGGWVTSSPTAVSWSSDHVAVFYRGNDGRIWYVQRMYGGAWSGGSHFGAYAQNGTDITAVSRGVGLIDLFYKGNDAHTWFSSYVGGSWGGGYLGSPPGGSQSQPGAAATSQGELVVFVKGNPGLGGAVYKRSSWDGGASWSSYQIVGGILPFNNPVATAVPAGPIMAHKIDGGGMNLCSY